MTPTRTSNATQHALAVAAMVRACAAIRAALRHESGLEWSDRLEELLMDAQQLVKRLEQYASE